jgi:hypothetical protein
MSERARTNENNEINYNRMPDKCPLCHHAIVPMYIASTLIGKENQRGTVLEIIFKCTNYSCLHFFISSYVRQAISGNSMVGDFIFKSSEPIRFEPPSIPDEIEQLSQDFIKIYTQAAAAEKQQLDEIAGVGYRKALEFLIKDYCITINPEKEEEIKSKLLGAVINEFVNDQNIKNCAQRAAWLGNDETHYVRKWVEKDINDLKTLIQLTIGWIRNEILTKKYLKEMGKA